ncbi:MAG: hypothetical protein IJH07_05605 [Ruminococcus sp.]|nr:hypothetical protein [Ruminococcus sp.]
MSLTPFMFSAFFERAAVNKVDDLRGLGNCHQQAFLQNGARREICKKSVLVQEGIACEFYHQLLIKLVITNKLLSPMAVTHSENVGTNPQNRDSSLVIKIFQFRSSEKHIELKQMMN